jgi:hypothetical protein
MPEQEVVDRAKRDERAGKSPSTQAGEFVREEMDHIREGKHGARSTKQAIAIGLSKARRAGVKLPAPKKGKVSSKTRAQAARDTRRASRSSAKPSRKRSRATSEALRREGHAAASPANLSRQARGAAKARGRRSLQNAAAKAVRTKGSAGVRQSARKAARTRARNRAA